MFWIPRRYEEIGIVLGSKCQECININSFRLPSTTKMTFHVQGVIFVCLAIVILSCTREIYGNDEDTARNAKHFSLFSVVTFKNEECTSLTTFTGGATKGTCYTATECGDKKGTKSGNCASGFGVCCVFVENAGVSATITENRTHLRNPLYPAIETAGSGTTITYTINKAQDDVCQIRLDFDNFAIAGPSDTVECGGVCSNTVDTNCQDTWTTTLTNTGAMVPVLCGVMSGEHLYLDVGMLSTDTATIALALAATSATLTTAKVMRSWSVRTSQIPCWAPYRAPDGCHRYFMQAAGQIISPNFSKTPAGSARGAGNINSGLDLPSQNLRTCLRREKGMCCTMFQVCTHYDGIDLTEAVAGGANDYTTGENAMISEGFSFLIRTLGGNAVYTGGGNAAGESDMGWVDAACSLDYVEIPDSTTGKKNYNAAAQINSRYCGNRFGHIPMVTGGSGSMAHAPIWDCTEPWEVNYFTDKFVDDGTYVAVLDADLNRGMCLEFQQESC